MQRLDTSGLDWHRSTLTQKLVLWSNEVNDGMVDDWCGHEVIRVRHQYFGDTRSNVSRFLPPSHQANNLLWTIAGYPSVNDQ